jgi:hypothetical protein
MLASRVLALLAVPLVITAPAVPAVAASRSARSPDSGWLRPVDGPVVRPFEEPAGPYAAGHRGADLAAPPGTPVRAAGDGTVVYAGRIAGSLHVTVLHDHGLRTSYSFLSDVAVRQGSTVSRGDVLGTSGGAATGPDPDSGHDGAVLHLGLRVGDRYVDPMSLFAPVDLAAVVHLAPVGDNDDGSWSPRAERRALASSLAVPAAISGRGGIGGAGTGSDGGGCGDGVPLVGALVDTACDIAGWVDDHAAAVDAGLHWLQSVSGVADDTLASLCGAALDALGEMRDAASGTAGMLARTPAGQAALDLVQIGHRFVDGVTAECSTDAPDADGTGGTAHRAMVVAGINSAGAAGDRGPTTDLDVAALGYREQEGEVRWFSYAADGGAYQQPDTYGPIKVAARRLRTQLRIMQQEEPGREVDLLAHSQGGVIVDWFLTHLYDAADPRLPPLGNVVTLSSPHEGAPLATTSRRLDRSLVGGRVLEGVDAVADDLPPADSAAVRDLAEGSPLMDHLWDHGVPDHVDFTTIGAPEDVVVPANRIGVPGATETVQPVNALNEHSAIVRDPAALRAIRAALEHRPPPCVSVGTALRSAIAPVVISRTETSVGDALSGLEVRVG